MRPPADEQLRKVTLNLYDSDCIEAERRYGYGWSEILRNIWREHLAKHARKRFLGEFIDD